MKQNTFDILLDCYIKERIPDAEDILGVPRAPTLCYSPVAHVTIDGPRNFAQNREAHAFCSSPTAVKQFDGSRSSFQYQSLSYYPESALGVGVIQGQMQASVDVIDSPEIDQIQKCREIAQNLARIADSFEKGYTICDDVDSTVSADEHSDDLTPEERLALQKIFSQGPSQSISRIASLLADCFSSQTLQAVIRYLTAQNDDVSQQLAVAFELSTGLINIMGGKVLGTIRNVVGGMFRNQAELDDL